MRRKLLRVCVCVHPWGKESRQRKSMPPPAGSITIAFYSPGWFYLAESYSLHSLSVQSHPKTSYLSVSTKLHQPWHLCVHRSCVCHTLASSFVQCVRYRPSWANLTLNTLISFSISLALTVSDVGHREAPLEAPAHASIDTLGLPPARVFDPHKPVRLMPGELLGPLLDHIELVDGLNTTHD